MGKHAYLIIAHNNFNQLKTLIKCLDYKDNDIYIHIDAKAVFDVNSFDKVATKSKVVFTPRTNVVWGGYSVVESELILLKTAVKTAQYEYLHLLSGMDMPLKTQENIHAFFDKHPGEDFISLKELNEDNFEFHKRVRFYYTFNSMFIKGSKVGNALRKVSDFVQRILNVNRNKNVNISYGLGSQWFSITGKFAEYVVSQEQNVERIFKYGFCVDELAIQTVWLNWDAPNKKRYKAQESPYFAEDLMEILRAIDWHRGLPYTWREEDYEFLIGLPSLFARKFDEKTDDVIIKKIAESVTE